MDCVNGNDCTNDNGCTNGKNVDENDEYVNGCKLPNNFKNLDLRIQNKIINYLRQLNPTEVKAYNIAKRHLGSSFNLLRSNGYNDWLSSNK
jgi:hypothetical protein